MKPALSPTLIAQALQGTSDRHQVLIQAARMALRQRGGFIPSVCDVPPPDPCPEDDRATCSRKIFRYYWSLERKRRERKVIPEYVAQFTALHYRLPPEYLPRFVRVRNFRKEVAPVYGVRAGWLQEQMRAAGKLRYPTIRRRHDKGWESRHFFYRERYFGRLRVDDPAAAFDLLQSVWENESLYNRQKLVRHLQKNLIVSEEPFVKQMLAENALRNKSLERSFARKFYDMPDSQLHQTLKARALEILQYDSSTNQISMGYEKDDLKRVPVGGEYANWRLTLRDLLMTVSPQVWMDAWDIDSDTLITAFEQHDILQYYLKYQYEAALRSGATDFAKCVFYRIGDTLQRSHVMQMLAIAAPTTCQDMAIHWLRHSEKSLHANPVRYFLSSDKVQYDEPLVQALLDTLHTKLDSPGERRVQFLLKNLAHHIPLHLATAFLDAIYQGQIKPMDAKSSRSYDDLCVFMAFRQRMTDALHEAQS